ncbi:MAG: DUF120 domain-containing protein [Candidatus Aenigmarchaeota archaeon]|nr:DUF120 domain-containing protein [Candidatus Aenigmarchaeota archaeon]
MQVKGKVFSGVIRGGQLIEKFQPRLEGMLHFKPYPGTLDIKLDEKILDIKPYATKSIEHILLGGSVHRDAWLIPIILYAEKNGEKRSLPCWAIHFEQNIYKLDVLEIIAEQNLRETLHLEDGDDVTIEFTGIPEKPSARSKIKLVPRKKA